MRNGTWLLCLLFCLAGCSGEEAKAPEPPEAEAAAEISDLDRPVADLMAAACEHGIPQYTCDECRYEVGMVEVPPELLDPARGGTVGTMPLGSREIPAGMDLNGEVRLNEEKAVYLGPRVPGVVRRIRVDLGSRVGEGEILFEVESEDLRHARAAYIRALAVRDLARSTVKREEDLFERKICPEKDLLEARAALQEAEAEEKAARGQLVAYGLTPGDEDASGLLPIRAPFAGVVLERSLSLGALVQPGDRSLLLADPSRVWVLADLYEREVGSVLEAQAQGPVTAEVTVTAYPGKVFSGVLDRIGGTLDEATRTARARVVTENPGNLLRAGMFARVRLLLPGGGSALAVPRTAVLEDAGRSFVFVHATGPYYVRRAVTPGRAWDGWVEIAGDVKAGDVVVTDGGFLLKSDVLRSKMGAGCAD